MTNKVTGTVGTRGEASANMLNLGLNTYPGRGIVVGLDQTKRFMVQIYWIMGRSENSRNRVFSHDGTGRVFTEAADPAKVKDPSLIIYNAMRDLFFNGQQYLSVVSNGAQTDSVVKTLHCSRGDNLKVNLEPWSYEPDKPNYTQRITAAGMWMKYMDGDFPLFQISILRKSFWSDKCDRNLYEICGVDAGFGYCVTTYTGDGDPLPAFRGEPYLMPLAGDIEIISNDYWAMLNPDNKVSLAVKFIPKEGPVKVLIRNKYTKVA